MTSKQLKYAFKRAALSASPQVYWGVREFLRGPLEPEMHALPSLCDRRLNALDIGANWGAYGFRCASLCRHVFCFEPQPNLARVLRRGVGRLGNVTVVQSAVSDVAGTAEIRVPRNDIGYSTIERANRLEGKVDVQQGVLSIEVPTCRLDDMELGPVGFIKIDVEGHELSVLKGASRLLNTDQPNLLIESEDRHNPGVVRELVQWLTCLGYEPCEVQGGALVSVAAGEHTGRNWMFRPVGASGRSVN